jgi:hypothetical protein
VGNEEQSSIRGMPGQQRSVGERVDFPAWPHHLREAADGLDQRDRQVGRKWLVVDDRLEVGLVDAEEVGDVLPHWQGAARAEHAAEFVQLVSHRQGRGRCLPRLPPRHSPRPA